MVFDKTGTLTEEGLEVSGCRGVSKIKSLEAEPMTRRDPPTFQPFASPEEYRTSSLDKDQAILMTGMVTCHATSNINGRLVGDPLDIKMFQQTGWTLDETNSNEIFRVYPPTSEEESKEKGFHSVIKVNDFNADLQRMSCIAASSSQGCKT